MSLNVTKGQNVLLLWSGKIPPKQIEEIVCELNSNIGNEGKVSVEHEERLSLSSHKHSSFDVAMSGVLFPSVLVHSIELLSEVARILKPNGRLIIREPSASFGNLRSLDKIVSTLKLSGFVNVSEAKEVCLTDEEKLELRQLLGSQDSVTIYELTSSKPSFEVGAKTQLSFANKIETKPKVDENVAKIWTLSAQDDDLDILDSDTLLDEEDLKKPDPASLKSDCGTSKGGKKKACKNCTCGLADELSREGGAVKTTTKATSSCGSCYLGDAFRCASCPYLGMPAFKPGEKIALTARQLKGDI